MKEFFCFDSVVSVSCRVIWGEVRLGWSVSISVMEWPTSGDVGTVSDDADSGVLVLYELLMEV